MADIKVVSTILMIILQKSLKNSGNFRVIMADMFDLLFKHGSLIFYGNVPFALKKRFLMHFDSRKAILLNIIIQYYNLMILYEITGTPFFVTNFKTGNPMKNAARGRTVTLRLLKVGVTGIECTVLRSPVLRIRIHVIRIKNRAF